MNGDIDLSEITQEEFEAKTPSVQNWILFKAVQHHSTQPGRCKKIFVTRTQMIVAGALIVGIGIGAGKIPWTKVLAFLG